MQDLENPLVLLKIPGKTVRREFNMNRKSFVKLEEDYQPLSNNIS